MSQRVKPILTLYTSFFSILSLSTPTSTYSSPAYYMSQYNIVKQLQLLIRQQSEQLATLQVQLVAGLEEIEREEEIAPRLRHEFQLKVAKPLLFDRDLVKVVGL